MTSKRISAPFDLASEFESDDDQPKKATTLTRQATLVQPPAPAKPFCLRTGWVLRVPGVRTKNV